MHQSSDDTTELMDSALSESEHPLKVSENGSSQENKLTHSQQLLKDLFEELHQASKNSSSVAFNFHNFIYIKLQ